MLRILPSDCLLVALNRVQVLELIPRGGAALEIGVNQGAYARRILERAAPQVLHLVDPWPTDRSDEYVKSYNVRDDMEARYRAVLQLFDGPIRAGQVVVHRAYSQDAAATFADASLDFIYVDAMHSYQGCLDDLLAYAPKLKSTGVLMGHDFSNTSTGRKKQFGVVAAVRDFLRRSDFMPVMITLENAPSYLLARHHATREALIAAALAKAPGVLAALSRVEAMQQIALKAGSRTVELMRL